jgi:hypothetical protein
VHVEDQLTLICVKRYEPFVLLRKEEKDGSQLPRYREGFVGRHYDKVSFVIELRALGYHFHTLRQHLLTHVPHNRVTKFTRHYEEHRLAMHKVLVQETKELDANIRRLFRQG